MRSLMESEAYALSVAGRKKIETLFIDEGQDLGQEAFEVLSLLAADAAGIVWMEDADQNLGQRAIEGGHFEMARYLRLRLPWNYRSPNRIARFMRDRLPLAFDPANALPGYPVRVTPVRDAEDQMAQVEAAVERLLADGFGPADIVIISCRGLQHSVFAELDRIGTHRLRRFTGRYEEDRQVYSEGDLTFETVRRFKGQQAPAILLIDVDPRERQSVGLRALYRSMSRATAYLEIFAK